MSSNHTEATLLFSNTSVSLENSGGKGANLAILSRDGKIPVPPGFVVSTVAYHTFLENEEGLLNEIKSALSKLKRADGEQSSTTPAELEVISNTIREAFRKRTMSKDLRAEIESRINELFPAESNTYLAVRSSATCEDLPDASFAGQHDTFLNVHPDADNVCKHVIDCFSSLFTSRAIAYRERNGLSHIDAGMAVVVQAMVQSVSSGVLFTANPLTGRRNESVLEVIPGLGEALVSGLTEPDRYIVSRTNSDIVIKDKRIGKKIKTIRSVAGGGVREEITDLSANDGDTSSVLTDEEVIALIKLGQTVENLFGGKSQDVEWAKGLDGVTFIVQSRPITTLFPLPDKFPAVPLQVFFSFNAVQGIAGPFYPAGQDAIRRGVLAGILKWATFGTYDGSEGKFMAIVGQRLYANVTNILRNSIGRKILTKFLFAGVEPGIAAGVNELLDEPGLEINSGMSLKFFFRLFSIATMASPRFFSAVLSPDWSRRRLESRVNFFIIELEREASGIDGLSELVAFKREKFQCFFPSLLPHFIPRMAVVMQPLLLLMKLASNVAGGKDLVLLIMRGLPHNTTTEMDLCLWRVAQTIQSDTESLKYFQLRDADTLAENYLNGSLPGLAQRTISAFLEKYGMRGLNEIDFGCPRWREEPSPLMNTLKSYIQISKENAPDVVFKAGEVAAEEAIQKLGKETGRPRIVSFLAKRLRCMGGIRELPKFTIIRMMGIMRIKMLKEGHKLVAAGIIDDAKDLFLLHYEELEALDRGELKNCKKLVKERKKTMEAETQRTRIPRVLASDGFAFYGGAVSKASVKEGENVLAGEPVSPGSYEGHIRVVHNPSKTNLSPGEILCCHGTDPSWTPLFLSAGALVMEVGGLMTHGSVVAREYGIPAVVGLERITEKLTTGQLVRVDGSTGIVEVLQDTENNDAEEAAKDDAVVDSPSVEFPQ